jgi:uncharacterized protein (TIGR04222 family)
MPGDTWGISGPDFLNVYLGALVVFVVLAIVIRLSATRTGSKEAGRLPSAAEAATMLGGRDRAVHASLAGLRASKLIYDDKQGYIAAVDTTPPSATRLDQAVLDAVRRRVSVRSLRSDAQVYSAAAEVEEAAVRAGWMLEPAERVRARLGALLLLGLVALGVVRIVAGVNNERPVGFLIALTVLTAIAAVVFFVTVPRMTRSGRAALAEVRTRNRHLDPRQSPSWATYGATGAAMGVAIYGAAALWAADPAFAALTGLPRQTATDSGGYAGTTYGGDSGGGGGDGGGGGGGGGCGGGGCGG